MARDIERVELSLERLTAWARRMAARTPEMERLGWWVLACGDVLDENDFEARELCRAELLARVEAAGIMLPERIWVWDETGRALLVVATLPSRARAEYVAERLRDRGLDLVVRREMDENDPGAGSLDTDPDEDDD